jgi:ABC-type Fe3+ transport system substrate-binding protein
MRDKSLMSKKSSVNDEIISSGLSLATTDNNEVKRMQKSLLKPGCLNVYVSMPCPLKVPFQQAFKPFVERWNANNANKPVYWPTVTDCSPEGIEKMMTAAITADELPDIFVTAAYNIVFSKPFHQRFIETGLFGGIPNESYGKFYPQNILDASRKFNVGFLGFSSWGLVRDHSVKGNFPVPGQWNDLVQPEYKGLFSMHGCHGHAGSLSMLLELKKKTGDEAISKLADNTHKVRHFAELIKAMGTAKSETPYYILPYVAIANIPSSKRAELLKLNGGIITSMMVIVNQSKLETYDGIINFFTGRTFRQLLEESAYFQPDSVAGIESHNFADLELLSELYYDKVTDLTASFIDMLGNKIG